MRSKLLLVMLMLPVALAFACSSGGSSPRATGTPAGTPKPEGTTVTSDDGKLSIFIPKGAMPEGTNVSATAVPRDLLAPELGQLLGAGTGYRLEPDGLTFSQPVDVTLTLDRAELQETTNAQSAYGLVTFSPAAGREILTGLSTTVRLDDSAVVVRGKLSHFSEIGHTLSSLELAVEVLPLEHLVGVPFTAQATVRNLNPTVVAVTQLEGQFDSDAAIDKAVGVYLDTAFVGDENIPALNGDGFSKTGTFVCEREGRGYYGAQVHATTRVFDTEGVPIFSAPSLYVLSPVVCVKELETPVQTPGGGEEVVVSTTGGCRHTNPGVETEARDRVHVERPDGSAVAGAQVEGRAEGPGVLQNTATAGTNGSGEALLAFRINLFGPYTMTVTQVTLPDGAVAVFDPSSVLQTTYTVGGTCVSP